MHTISLVKPLFLTALLGLSLLALSCTRQAAPAARNIAPLAAPLQSFVATSPTATPPEQPDPNIHALEESSAQPAEPPPPDSVQVAQAGAASPAIASKSQGTPVIPDWAIAIPSLNIRSEVVAVGLEDDGAMQAPSGPDEVGWYQFGPTPGQQGNVLLAGHVDWTDRQTGRARGAVFWSLSRAPVGSEVVVSDGASDYMYYVAEKYRFAWDDPAGVSVLQPTEDYRLTLITCGGNFDRSTRSYNMRDVVIAYLVG